MPNKVTRLFNHSLDAPHTGATGFFFDDVEFFTTITQDARMLNVWSATNF